MATENFIPAEPSAEDCWRGVILYGRNTASYKFALATTLLTIKPDSGQLVKLEDLAPTFARSIAERLRVAPKQITTNNGKFIRACHEFNEKNDLSRLVDATVAYGFANVIDAFHVVGSSPVHHAFFVDERKRNQGIRITDEFEQMLDGAQVENLGEEVTARWRLVEPQAAVRLASRTLRIPHVKSAGTSLLSQTTMPLAGHLKYWRTKKSSKHRSN
jgi:hypothetical protein